MTHPIPDNPEPELSDELTPGKSEPDRISDSPAGRLLSNFLDVMNGEGDDAQEAYDAALNDLRERAGDVIMEIARAAGHCAEENYPLRWALVHVAAELRHPDALPFLRNVVLTPIPEERSPDPHSFSTAAEETIIRTTAVEGVEYLAGEGFEPATETLFQFLEVPSLSVRRAAVQGILATDEGSERRERIAELLPQDQRFLLDIKRVNVSDVPQVEDPQRHLREEVRDRETDPPPRIPGQPEGDAPKTY